MCAWPVRFSRVRLDSEVQIDVPWSWLAGGVRPDEARAPERGSQAAKVVSIARKGASIFAEVLSTKGSRGQRVSARRARVPGRTFQIWKVASARPRAGVTSPSAQRHVSCPIWGAQAHPPTPPLAMPAAVAMSTRPWERRAPPCSRPRSAGTGGEAAARDWRRGPSPW